MLLKSFNFIRKKYLQDPLRYIELTCLSLMLISLPSVEAPKNIFLVFFLATSLYRKFKQKIYLPAKCWDYIFIFLISSSLLSAIFSGIQGGKEWSGFWSALIWFGFAWTLSKSQFTSKEIKWIILLTILSTIPPLLFGLIQYFILHSKDTLELHSVGHVNHSAIYLGIIFGTSLSLYFSEWNYACFLKRLILAILPILFFTSIIIGQSRGVFGAALILFLLLYYFFGEKKLIILLLMFSTLLLMVILNAGIIYKQRINLSNNDVLADRSRVWNVSLEAINLYPILGVGNGNWNRITIDDLKKSRESRGLAFDEKKYSINHGHSHNIFLSAFVERGVVGFLAILTLMINWLISLCSNYNLLKKKQEGVLLWGASISAWTITFVVGLVNSTLHHEHAILALLFLGLHISYLNNGKKRNSPQLKF